MYPEAVLKEMEQVRRVCLWRARRGLWANVGEPEDAAQEAALAVLELYHDSPEARNFGAYAQATAVRHLWSLHHRGRIVLRSARRVRRGPPPQMVGLPKQITAPECEEAAPCALPEAMESLPGLDRAILEHCYGFHGRQTLREIGAALGMTRHAVDCRRRRAIRRLQRLAS